MRELADWSPDRYDAVLRWPLREALLAYIERLKASARQLYDRDLLIWAILAPYSKDARAPKLPEILAGD